MFQTATATATSMTFTFAPAVTAAAPAAMPTRDRFTLSQFETALQGYVEKLQARENNHYATRFPNLTAPTIEVHRGKRYMKIVTNSVGQGRSVHTFIDSTNGDVLKAAGWNAPAKHARGSIFSTQNGMEACSVYGGNYLR